MKNLFICLTFLLSFQSFASDKLLCSSYYLFKYQDMIPSTEVDKVKHCSFSCILAIKCGKVESYTVGYIKEFADLLGMGDPDWQDIEANKRGIRLSKSLRNFKQCLPKCQELYPR